MFGKNTQASTDLQSMTEPGKGFVDAVKRSSHEPSRVTEVLVRLTYVRTPLVTVRSCAEADTAAQIQSATAKIIRKAGDGGSGRIAFNCITNVINIGH